MQPTFEQDSAQLRQQFNTAVEKLGSQTSIPSYVRSSLEAEFGNIGEKYWSFSVNCLAEIDKLATERLNLVKQIDDQQRLIKSAISEKHHANAKIGDMQRQQAKEIAELRKELFLMEQKVDGKRSLWTSTAITKGDREPSLTTLVASAGNDLQPASLLNKFKNIETVSEASRTIPLIYDTSSSKQFTIPNLKDRIDGTALVPFRTEQQIAVELSEEFKAFFDSAEKWVRTYTSIVPDLIPLSNRSVLYGSDIYHSMLRSCHNPLETANAHVDVLMQDTLGRPMLFLRVLISYVNEKMWNARAFIGRFDIHSKKLEGLEKDLGAKGLTSKQRAKLINAQTQVIRSIMEHEQYPTFRMTQLGEHSSALRQLLGTLLVPKVDRAAAGRDLSQLVAAAFLLATRMQLANRTFFVRFPATGSRFVDTWMVCHDPEIKESPLDLHRRHARVKLTVTPAITMRNDLNGTIETTPVHRARVLVSK